MNIDTDRFLNYGIENSIILSELGTCTHRHRDVVYSKGFEDESALTLAYLASHLVDAAKLGLRLQQNEWMQLLRSPGVPEPRYVKPRGERTAVNSNHVLDILTDVIPAFTENILLSFHSKFNRAEYLPLDPDIKEFYLSIKARYPQVVDSLSAKLAIMKIEWTKYFTRQKSFDSVNRDNSDCSPKKRQKRLMDDFEDSVLVSFYLFFAEIGSTDFSI
jgi:RNA dependent RNA polymerase